MIVGMYSDTIFPNPDGVGVAIEALGIGLQHLGVSVELVAPRQPCSGTFTTRVVASIRPPGRDYHVGLVLPWCRSRRTSADRYDIVHVHTLGPVGLAGLRAAHYAGVPAVLTWHTDLAAYRPYYPEVRLGALIAGVTLLGLDTSSNKRELGFSQQAVIRRLLSSFDTIIVPTSKVYRQLRDLDCPRPVAIIPNPTLPLNVPCSSPADIRSDCNLPKDAQIILSVGRLTQEKNPDLLLRAFMLLKRTRPNAQLVLVGPSRGHRHLKRLARTLSIADSVHMPGPVGRDLLGGYYRLADIFVLPSLSETQSLAAQEAEAYGIPVIVVDDSLESTYGDSRRVVNPPYPRQLAQSIDDCLGNGDYLHDGYPGAEDFCPAITDQSARLYEIYSFLVQAGGKSPINSETC